MKIFKLLFVKFLLVIIKLPRFLIKDLNSYNFYLLKLKNQLRISGELLINKKLFKYDTDSFQTYQRYTKLLKKEPDTISWINSFNEGEIFWDIGANVGVFSFYAAYNNVKTYSFEPDPFNYREMIKMTLINHNKNIFPFLIGISSADIGYFSLEFADDGLDSGRSMRSINSTGIVNMNINSINTMTMNLTSLVKILNIDFPNHIKIDVDGNELSILKNQNNFLIDPRLKSVLIEVDENDKVSLDSIMNIMISCNFQLSKRVDSYTGSHYINYIFNKH